MAKRELLLGCGYRPYKKAVCVNERGFENVTGLDSNPDCEPDVLWDLTQHPLPFDADTFDEVHAYDVLEHLAHQGDYEFFFKEFTEYWRVLKSGGYFCGTVPHWQSQWAWGDPSHRRVITADTLRFLDQAAYEEVGKTKMSDYRWIYKADFPTVRAWVYGESLIFVLQARKGKMYG
jgi:SAM-dependent methyltransferase